ncbi:MAG: hypothetical protein ACRBCT_01575 [Alphaproteobacteria bacterium]
MTHTQNTPTPQETRAALKAEMAEICEHLKFELENPDIIATALERQTVIMDRLLYAVMRRALKDDIENGDFNKDHLNKILRIQKQSADSYKAVYTIKYLESLIESRDLERLKLEHRNNPFRTPSPHSHDEQSEDAWIL